LASGYARSLGHGFFTYMYDEYNINLACEDTCS
jgi:hypothetical protein